MAQMIPDDLDEFKTEGERRFYEFLARFAKPDEKFTTWYLPDIEGKEPDFILYSDAVGLIIFEIKDWSLAQIEKADPHAFVLTKEGKQERFKSPLGQARDYLYALIDKLRKDGHLLSKDPAYSGSPKIPIECGVVFPNINKHAYRLKNLDQVIEVGRIFFQDDLDPASDICNDSSGTCFQNRLSAMFPPRFRFQFTRGDYNRLKQILFPSICVQHTLRGSCFYIDPKQRANVLDDRQEAIARRLIPEINVIKGSSGSGKTLVLVHRAMFCKMAQPHAKVLFLCYNITLVHYIKRLLSEKGVGFGADGVQVFNFFELCSKLLGQEIQHENEGEDYYQLVQEETLFRLGANPIKYDAVLIDEGQDFSAAMLEIVSELLTPDKSFLTIALDEAQNIYDVNPLESLNRICAKIRVDELPATYRNTVEIRNFVSKYMGDSVFTNNQACDISGPLPDLRQVQGIREAADYVADLARKFVDGQEYPPSEIAVLYARSISKPSQISIPHLVMERLESKGLVCNWVAEDYRAKRAYDITAERISISTIHSAKGLDWACVFLLGLDELETGKWSAEKIRGLTYVAITRARHRLCIPFSTKSTLISQLLRCV